MKLYPLFTIVGLALMSVSTAYAGANTALQSTSTPPSSDPVKTIVHVAASAEPETTESLKCIYNTWQECIAACGGSLCAYCTGNAKYACKKN